VQISIEPEYGQFMQTVATLLPIRLDCYKPKQMERRIRDLARKHHAADLHAFATLLRTNRDVLREFEQHITINVSEFYRNPDAFDYLNTRILPRLQEHTRGMRVWSAGCSNGSEPYTIAMLLQQAYPARRHTILATDIDRAMLDRARSAKGYIADDVRALPARLRDAYMTKNDAAYCVADQIVKMVRFDRLDLLRDQVGQVFDLIVCRNVVIYFTDEAKTGLYEKFVEALEPGGHLFLGATETISRPGDLGLKYVAPCFYVKARP
jgi:chemotaxis protein methyltransferase CheR